MSENNRITRPSMPSRGTSLPQHPRLARIREESQEDANWARPDQFPISPTVRQSLNAAFSSTPTENVRLRTFQRHELLENMQMVLVRLERLETELLAMKQLYEDRFLQLEERASHVGDSRP